MTTLYISDLDGTLFGADSRVSPESTAIIRDLPPSKIFTIATARTPATVDLILPPEIGPAVPAIVISGAALWHRAERRYSDVHTMAPEATDISEEIMLRHGLAPFTYTIDAPRGMLYAYGRIPSGRPCFEPLTPAERGFVDERRNLPLKHIYIDNRERPFPPLLVFGIGSRATVERAAEDIASEIDCAISVYGDVFNPTKGFIEVFAPGVSKGAAALRVKEMVGADRIVAFGDSNNDIPLLRAADVAIAVEGASSNLKAIADIVIGPNTDSAVARFMSAERP